MTQTTAPTAERQAKAKDLNAALNEGALILAMVPAAIVKVGDRVVERDGSFFRVTAIEDAGRSFIFSLANEAGHMVAATHAKVSKRSNVRVMAVSL